MDSNVKQSEQSDHMDWHVLLCTMMVIDVSVNHKDVLRSLCHAEHHIENNLKPSGL